MLAKLTEIALGSLTTAALGAVLYNPESCGGER